MDPQNTNHLLRIRENQRRSRARRKDRLQELETKLRQCEVQGVEASSEIQLAARRVADENKRLRKLLAQHGIADVGVSTSKGNDSSIHGERVQHKLEGEAVQVLEGLLVTRKCCTDRIPSTNLERLYRAGEKSCIDTIPTRRDSEAGLEDPGALSSSTASSPFGLGAAISQPPEQPPKEYFQSSDFASQPFDTYESHSEPRHESQETFPLHIQIGISTEHNAPLSANSCIFAADMITTMAGGDPLTVREELGCLPGMDCEVDNSVVFNVMGRYRDIGAPGA